MTRIDPTTAYLQLQNKNCGNYYTGKAVPAHACSDNHVKNCCHEMSQPNNCGSSKRCPKPCDYYKLPNGCTYYDCDPCCGANLPELYLLLNQTTREFAEAAAENPPIYDVTPEEARAAIDALQIDQSYKATVDITDIEVTYEGQNLSLTIFRPKNTVQILPAAVYMHGGGWVVGNKETHGRSVSEIAVGANIGIVFVNYPLAPEQRYPTQIEYCYLATQYVYNNASLLNLSSNRLILIGDSVGGQMAASTAIIGLQDSTIKLGYLVLISPVTSAKMDTQSYEIYCGGPWLTKPAMIYFFDEYVPDPEDRDGVDVSPANASLKQLARLPPTLVITAENDVLRDEGENFAHQLILADVTVTATRYLGTIHDFTWLDPIKDTTPPIAAIQQIINVLKNFLAQ